MVSIGIGHSAVVSLGTGNLRGGSVTFYPCVSSQASPSMREQSRQVLNDGSCWTIIGTEVVEYTFSEGLACVQTSVSPIPVINGLEVRLITTVDHSRNYSIQS